MRRACHKLMVIATTFILTSGVGFSGQELSRDCRAWLDTLLETQAITNALQIELTEATTTYLSAERIDELLRKAYRENKELQDQFHSEDYYVESVREYALQRNSVQVSSKHYTLLSSEGLSYARIRQGKDETGALVETDIDIIQRKVSGGKYETFVVDHKRHTIRSKVNHGWWRFNAYLSLGRVSFGNQMLFGLVVRNTSHTNGNMTSSALYESLCRGEAITNSGIVIELMRPDSHDTNTAKLVMTIIRQAGRASTTYTVAANDPRIIYAAETENSGGMIVQRYSDHVFVNNGRMAFPRKVTVEQYGIDGKVIRLTDIIADNIMSYSAQGLESDSPRALENSPEAALKDLPSVALDIDSFGEDINIGSEVSFDPKQ